MPKKTKKTEEPEVKVKEIIDDAAAEDDAVIDDDYTEEESSKKNSIPQELLDKLVALGKSKNNTLDMKDISKVFQNVNLSPDSLDEIITYLESKHITLRILQDDAMMDDDFLDGDLDLLGDEGEELDLDIDNIDLL